jgi:hypothetical protein
MEPSQTIKKYASRRFRRYLQSSVSNLDDCCPDADPDFKEFFCKFSTGNIFVKIHVPAYFTKQANEAIRFQQYVRHLFTLKNINTGAFVKTRIRIRSQTTGSKFDQKRSWTKQLISDLSMFLSLVEYSNRQAAYFSQVGAKARYSF